MRTLDEVVKAYEYCQNGDWKVGCGDCVYKKVKNGACKCVRNDDALHYLKEYKDKSHWLDIQISDHVRAFEQWSIEMARLKENPPLTWDELRTMEGKPVWIEFLNDEGEWNGEWCLVESSNNILCEILRCKMSWWGLRKITLGKTWKAYRKERS